MERIVCLLILLSLRLFAQDEFIFWAELSSKNYILFHQSQNLSIAMTRSEGFVDEYVCELGYTPEDLRRLPRTGLGLVDGSMSKMEKLAFLNSHKDALSECFISAKISVKDLIRTDLLEAQSETYVKILPLRFSVEFGENVATIFLKK
ncbi:hypothetical protein [Campylobacter sp.]|uniref:hypothetical protein n=1 Tax=Campylobacter sp. TaxID=205 RepID=UPI0026DD0600|nr:hypothetical protein [Campylobacter sp.]MDO4674168.1 hypothetical protein [Campylobacter sp.]